MLPRPCTQGEGWGEGLNCSSTQPLANPRPSLANSMLTTPTSNSNRTTPMIFPWPWGRMHAAVSCSAHRSLTCGKMLNRCRCMPCCLMCSRASLINKVRIMVAERIWVGSNGLELTEAMKIVVAAQAVVLLAGDDGYLYERLPAI